ncbi:MAG: hypothetical protein ACJAU5_001370 [Maricaulis maris]|jgi:hypothetical protein|uniref:DUF1223 domain-containing protein n=1 Tax=Maricaulis maris TaxID=74318 RepID=UPI0026F01A41|nr:DUF1223 domain-containing protein [Maricaulis maris]
MKWLAALLLSAFGWACLPAAGAFEEPGADDERPVLVELFTSQGCGLCPEANRYLGELDQRDNVFVLAYAVSYWDMYGWTDTYARPEYVQRQRTYLPRLDVPRLYTPHFVVDGVTDAPGWEQDAVANAVDARLTAMPGSPVITVADGPFGSFQVSLDGEAPEEDLDVWLVAYAPGWASVSVRSGENEGLDMLHYNMVKSLTYLGNWSGGPAVFTGESFRRFGTVAIVQGANGGPVYGYARVAASGAAPR